MSKPISIYILLTEHFGRDPADATRLFDEMLTPQERIVATAIAACKSRTQCAAEIGISSSGFQARFDKIRAKLGVAQSGAEAMVAVARFTTLVMLWKEHLRHS